jgi:response regulator NasT
MPELQVLVAEPQRVEAVHLKAELRRLGHQVVGVARDGLEAAVLASELQPDLVIADIRLPLMDGIEVARTILTRHAMPIILCTAYASAALVRRAREAGVLGFLAKPVDRTGLRAAIESALARFGELHSVRQDVSDLQEALKAREMMEQARRILMRWSRISEVEAFQRMEGYRRSTGRDAQAIATGMVKADEFLFRRRTLAEFVQVILGTVRRAQVALTSSAGGWATPRRFPHGWRQKNSTSWEG